MKNLASQFDRWMRQRFPQAYYHVVQRPRLRFQFRAERRLATGAASSHSERRSIVFFTTQKCASRYVSELIAKLAVPARMIHADYDAYVSMVRVPREINPFQGAMGTAFQTKGYYYGPIGTLRNIPRLGEYSVVLQLRDPRDVLTSLYFSTAYSHALISAKVLRRRKEALAMSVDEFALAEIEEYVPIYEQYCGLLETDKSVLFLRYEDMVTNFPDWLGKLSHHIGLDDQNDAIERIRQEADFSVSAEDVFSQRRQVAPGDHIRKLQPATIDELNRAFKGVLIKLGYVV